MGSIRRLESQGTLFMDFRYAGQRLREYTMLPDMPANRKRLQKALNRIETDIALGTFDYEKTFGKPLPQPEPKITNGAVDATARPDGSPVFSRNGTPIFREFAQQWFTEVEVSWRRSYPSKPIRLIVPFGPGGSTDNVGRLYAKQLSDRLGQPVIVENRPGASTNIAALAVSLAEPDGYTLLLGTNQAIINSVYGPKPSFDAVNGFAPVGLVAELPYAVIVRADSPIRSVADLVEAGRKTELPVSSAQFEPQLKLLSSALGIPLLSIPFTSGAQATSALLSGEVTASLSVVSVVSGQVKAGRLRLIGVASTNRLRDYPDVPTFAEQGFARFTTSAWIDVLAPKGTPDPVLSRLSEATTLIVRDQRFVERLRATGAEPLEGSPAATAARMAAEHSLWLKTIRQ